MALGEERPETQAPLLPLVLCHLCGPRTASKRASPDVPPHLGSGQKPNWPLLFLSNPGALGSSAFASRQASPSPRTDQGAHVGVTELLREAQPGHHPPACLLPTSSGSSAPNPHLLVPLSSHKHPCGVCFKAGTDLSVEATRCHRPRFQREHPQRTLFTCQGHHLGTCRVHTCRIPRASLSLEHNRCSTKSWTTAGACAHSWPLKQDYVPTRGKFPPGTFSKVWRPLWL